MAEPIQGVPTPESTEPDAAGTGGIPGVPTPIAGNGSAEQAPDPLPAPSIPRRPLPPNVSKV